MEKGYKGSVQKMNESRDYFKSLLNEQGVILTGVRACRCSEWNGTSCEGSLIGMTLKPYVNNGNIPVAGDTFVGAGANGQEWVIDHIDPNNSGGGTHVNQTEGCGMTANGCPIGTFMDVMVPILQGALQQFVDQLLNNWVPMFHGKYFNHNNQCNFLQNRLTINQNKLDGLIAAGTNPQWQAMLTAKTAAIQAIIDECCN